MERNETKILKGKEITMGKKILVLNGGPRLAGNTAALITAFVEGAEAAGNVVTCG